MSKCSIILERTSLFAGVSLLALTGLVWLDGITHSRAAVTDFERIRERIVKPENQANWSEQRKADYQRALFEDAGSMLAVLRIPSTAIEVPVFDSTASTALNRGSGHVSDTALPGENGNIAIAGHRDGFFRGLKDIEVGAEIEVTTLHGSRTFRVIELRIVDPLDVSVLEPTGQTVLTLITCYPFYYVGPAPERFIVRAVLPEQRESHDLETESRIQPLPR